MSGIYNLVQGYTSTRECSEHYPKAHECDPTASRACAILAKQSLYWLHCKLSPEVKIVKKKKKKSCEDPSGPDLQAQESILFVLQALQQ